MAGIGGVRGFSATENRFSVNGDEKGNVLKTDKKGELKTNKKGQVTAGLTKEVKSAISKVISEATKKTTDPVEGRSSLEKLKTALNSVNDGQANGGSKALNSKLNLINKKMVSLDKKAAKLANKAKAASLGPGSDNTDSRDFDTAGMESVAGLMADAKADVDWSPGVIKVGTQDLSKISKSGKDVITLMNQEANDVVDAGCCDSFIRHHTVGDSFVNKPGMEGEAVLIFDSNGRTQGDVKVMYNDDGEVRTTKLYVKNEELCVRHTREAGRNTFINIVDMPLKEFLSNLKDNQGSKSDTVSSPDENIYGPVAELQDDAASVSSLDISGGNELHETSSTDSQGRLILDENSLYSAVDVDNTGVATPEGSDTVYATVETKKGGFGDLKVDGGNGADQLRTAAARVDTPAQSLMKDIESQVDTSGLFRSGICDLTEDLERLLEANGGGSAAFVSSANDDLSICFNKGGGNIEIRSVIKDSESGEIVVPRTTSEGTINEPIGEFMEKMQNFRAKSRAKKNAALAKEGTSFGFKSVQDTQVPPPLPAKTTAQNASGGIHL